jgi:hypothetical protein
MTAHPVGHFPLWAGPRALHGLHAALQNCSSTTPSPEHYRTFARHELELQSLIARVRLESVALTRKTLYAVGCHPLAGGLATPAAESMHHTLEPHPRACSGQSCGHAPWAGQAAHGLCSSWTHTTVESGRVLAQWATLHCGARPRGSFSPWHGCKNINPFFFYEINFKSDSNFQNSLQIRSLSNVLGINSVILLNSRYVQKNFDRM